MRQRARIKQAAVGFIVLIEYVLDEAINLQLLADLIGGVRAEDNVAWDLRQRAVLVAEYRLAGRRDHVAADFPFVGDIEVEADFQGVFGNARDRRAVGDRNEARGIGGRIERRRLHERREVDRVDI